MTIFLTFLFIIVSTLSLLSWRQNLITQWPATRLARTPHHRAESHLPPRHACQHRREISAGKNPKIRDSNTLANSQPPSVTRILGDWNLMELTGDDHRRIRSALVSFLKPDSLKRYVKKMDDIVREHLDVHWKDHQTVTISKQRNVLF
ncbi:hypothetical protein RJ641_015722 [Dillenia turbinata]|uniref:Uncharacterized protein n=1 Tax=Dillenia turbinata TaxID=194707 RepID=A0AAN8Z3Z2_9MAGN